MKNDFCELSRKEIDALHIPINVQGFLLSPFQFNVRDGFVLVPTEAFEDLISLITQHAIRLHSDMVGINGDKLFMA